MSIEKRSVEHLKRGGPVHGLQAFSKRSRCLGQTRRESHSYRVEAYSRLFSIWALADVPRPCSSPSSSTTSIWNLSSKRNPSL